MAVWWHCLASCVHSGWSWATDAASKRSRKSGASPKWDLHRHLHQHRNHDWMNCSTMIPDCCPTNCAVSCCDSPPAGQMWNLLLLHWSWKWCPLHDRKTWGNHPPTRLIHCCFHPPLWRFRCVCQCQAYPAANPICRSPESVHRSPVNKRENCSLSLKYNRR